MPKVIKPSNPFTNVCWVSVLTTFLRRHKFWLHQQFSPPSNSRNEEVMGDGFLWCYCCRFVSNSKRLLSTSCNKALPERQKTTFFILLSCIVKNGRILCDKQLNDS